MSFISSILSGLFFMPKWLKIEPRIPFKKQKTMLPQEHPNWEDVVRYEFTINPQCSQFCLVPDVIVMIMYLDKKCIVYLYITRGNHQQVQNRILLTEALDFIWLIVKNISQLTRYRILQIRIIHRTHCGTVKWKRWLRIQRQIIQNHRTYTAETG